MNVSFDIMESGFGGLDNISVIDSNTSHLSCVERSIQNPVILPYSSAFITTVTVIRTIFWLLLLVAGCFLNVMVIILFAKYKKLQVLSFAISLQIVALDLVLSVMIPTVSLINQFAGRWVYGKYVCTLVGMLGFVTAAIRTLLMLVFVIDRFLSIFCPFFYPRHQKKTVVSLSTFSWVFTVACGAAIAAVDCYSFMPYTWLCGTEPRCSNACSIFINLHFAIAVLPIIIAPIVLYILLLVKAQKIKKNSILAYAEHASDWKTAVTFFLLFLSVFLVTVPTFVVLIVIGIVYGSNHSLPPATYTLHVFSTGLLSLLVVTDPIVIMRNRDVIEVLGELKEKVKIAVNKNCYPKTHSSTPQLHETGSIAVTTKL